MGKSKKTKEKLETVIKSKSAKKTKKYNTVNGPVYSNDKNFVGSRIISEDE